MAKPQIAGPISSLLLAFTVATMLTSACTTSSSGSAASATQSAAGDQPSRSSRLALALEGEPASLGGKFETLVGADEVKWLTNSPLAYQDDKAASHPRLAAELPSQDKGTWVVNPDGTMSTRWTIRPNALWHDGQPVTSDDFVFALKVYQDLDMPINTRDPERLIDHIQVDDAKSFTIFWKQPYPWAYRLQRGELEPLPAHILQSLYGGPDKAAFVNSRFWSSEYVGDGPYRLEHRDPGVRMTFRAFDQYYLGRPGIDEVVVTYVSDPAVLVSQFLSGTVDVVGSGNVLVTLDSYAGLQDQWRRTGEGRVLVTATSNRYFEMQLDPARAKQPALLDVRVRRALATAMDREGVAKIIVGPDVPAGDHVFAMFPTEAMYPLVDAAVARYPYDPRRALELLRDAGWTRQGDTLVNAVGEPFTLDMWSRPGLENQVTLFASNLQDIGIKPTVFSVPAARLEEGEYRANLPGLNIFGTSNRNPQGMQRMTSAQCPVAPRYAGRNYGCWSNAEYDRNYEIAINTLNEDERTQAIIAAYRAMYDDVGFIWLNYNGNVTVIRTGLDGAIGRPLGAGVAWNIHEWKWVK